MGIHRTAESRTIGDSRIGIVIDARAVRVLHHIKAVHLSLILVSQADLVMLLHTRARMLPCHQSHLGRRLRIPSTFVLLTTIRFHHPRQDQHTNHPPQITHRCRIPLTHLLHQVHTVIHIPHRTSMRMLHPLVLINHLHQTLLNTLL